MEEIAAVPAEIFDERRRAVLVALCDTFVPSVEVDSGDRIEREFMTRAASALAVPEQIEALLAEAMSAAEIEAIGGLLDTVAAEGFVDAPLQARTAIVHGFREADPDAKHGLRQLQALTARFFYSLPDAAGQNPNWEMLGYPGPPSLAPSPEAAPKTIRLESVAGTEATLRADIVVVGSGSGGSVIAARCAAAGRDVLVLEAGGYRNEADFNQLELPGFADLYYRAGLAASEDGSIAILAGATLGGGSVINYMNCVRTPAEILAEWTGYGLDGLDTPGFITEHQDVVIARLGVNTEATRQNATHQRLIAACDALGYEHRALSRNATAADDPAYCGFCSMGCQHGCKQSALKTWLQDASDHGARCLVGCQVDRIIVAGGAAQGVEATVTGPDGATTRLTVNATTVVVAAGGVESPALLLRSAIGGPAVGKNLRLHPAQLVLGTYDDPIEGWNGQIQSALTDHFTDIEDGFGFLVEAAGMHPGLVASSIPWDSGVEQKQMMARSRWQAPFISVARDHGAGEVVLDELGQTVIRWSLDDPVDERMIRRAHIELAKLHHAAGAAAIDTLHSRQLGWNRGEDFDAYLAAIESAPYTPNDITTFSAHQMGSCRMGSDPETSVADGSGRLHDTGGVWIGDGSAFPNAPGVNPMITIMSLAHRTAERILAAA